MVMDTFTDVDILADILNAALRNVAVYILLDEQSAHLFIQMVQNCRVNLQNFEVSKGTLPVLVGSQRKRRETSTVVSIYL